MQPGRAARCASETAAGARRNELRGMRNFISFLLVLLMVTGCSAGITTHDKARAAELIVDFLSSLTIDQGIHTAYEWADDSFRKETSLDEFTQKISTMRSKNSGADIRLVGYETFGSREMMVVYAISQKDDEKLHFKFSLVGTKHKDYYLLNFTTGDDEFSKDGIYSDYETTIIVQGV